MFKFPALAAACLLAACTAAPAATGAPQADIAQADMAAPAWAGTYAGTLPCADCEGIQIRLTLQPDLHYTLSQTYLRTGGNRSDSVNGQFYWADEGQTVQLDNYADARQFQIGPGFAQAFRLDGSPSGNDARYRLQKIH